MIIGINALYLLPGQVGGTEVYLRRLLRALQALDATNHYLVYTNAENRGTFELTAPNFREVPLGVRAESRVRRIISEQTLLPRRARLDGVDVLHSPGNTAPVCLHCASVTTLHDVGWHYFREDWSWAGWWANRLLIPPMNRRADAVITISESAKDEIMEVLGLAADHVRVIHHGVDGNLVDATADDAAAVTRRLGIEGDYILSVSGTHPHKNLDGLIRIYGGVLDEVEQAPALVLVGVRGTHQARIEQLATAHRGRGRIVLTGWIDDVALSALYRSARLFAFTSLYEGFGFPPLEAMSVGTPVVSSNATALAEIVGDGGILVDAKNEREVVNAIVRVLTDESLRQDLRGRGARRAAQFTWRQTAERTLAELTGAVRRRVNVRAR